MMSKTEILFRARLAELGATLLELEYLGSDTPHRVRCAAGHISRPTPHNAVRQGICSICAGNSSVELVFRVRLTELDVTLLEPEYLGAHESHRVRCSAGHEFTTRPSHVVHGHIPCAICAARARISTEAAFIARLTELGATLLEPEYHGCMKPHRVRCAAGHISMPWPNSVLKGQGICVACKGIAWDVFYIVQAQNGNVKFGITSGNARQRLGEHARHGYRRVLLCWRDLPNDYAAWLERSACQTLAAAGIAPVRGREYYPAAALSVLASVPGLPDDLGRSA